MADGKGGRKVGMLEQLSGREYPDASRGVLTQVKAGGVEGRGVLVRKQSDRDQEVGLVDMIGKLMYGPGFPWDIRHDEPLAYYFSRPGYISHRGAWKLDVRTMEIILGPGDSLPAVAEDLTGWRWLAGTIFPASAFDSRHVIGDRIPLIMKEDTFLRWTKEAWRKAVIGMTWEEYFAAVPATRDTFLPTAEQMARAFAKGWIVDGTKAMAVGKATLEDLAEAITGDRKDSRFLAAQALGGKAQPRIWIDISLLLRKAAGLAVPEPETLVNGVTPEFMRKATAYVADWEGRRNWEYRDKMGIPTIGVGFNLRARKEDFQRLLPGVSYEDVIAGRKPLTDAQVDYLFEEDMADNIRKALAGVPNLNSLPEEVRLVLVDMCHQFGNIKQEWRLLCAAIRGKNYSEAARQIVSQNWSHITPRRAEDHRRVIQGWAEEEQRRLEQEGSATP